MSSRTTGFVSTGVSREEAFTAGALPSDPWYTHAIPTTYIPPVPPAATATWGGGGSGNTLTASSNSAVYLFTFGITLSILACIVGVVLGRSYILRRNFRRRVEYAIAAGLLVPGVPPPRRREMVKPIMWDVWVKEDDGEKDWDGLLPVSASVISPQAERVRYVAPSPPPPPTTQRHDFLAPFLNLSRSLTRPRPRPAPLRSSPSTLPPPRSSEKAQAQDELQVSVLISMPSPPRAAEHYSGGHGGGEVVPDVVFGVKRLPWDQAGGD